MREILSVAPPGVHGTMNLMGLPGKESWARAKPGSNSVAVAPASRRRRDAGWLNTLSSGATFLVIAGSYQRLQGASPDGMKARRADSKRAPRLSAGARAVLKSAEVSGADWTGCDPTGWHDRRRRDPY